VMVNLHHEEKVELRQHRQQDRNKLRPSVSAEAG